MLLNRPLQIGSYFVGSINLQDRHRYGQPFWVVKSSRQLCKLSYYSYVGHILSFIPI